MRVYDELTLSCTWRVMLRCCVKTIADSLGALRAELLEAHAQRIELHVVRVREQSAGMTHRLPLHLSCRETASL